METIYISIYDVHVLFNGKVTELIGSNIHFEYIFKF